MVGKKINKSLSIVLALMLVVGGLGWSGPVYGGGSAAVVPVVVTPPIEGTPASATNVAWLSLTANGEANKTETTELTLTFDKEPTGLTAEHITVIGANKDQLDTDGQDQKIKKLSISNLLVKEGETITVSIGLAGYTITPSVQTVAVHREKVKSQEAKLATVAGEAIAAVEAAPGAPMAASISVRYNQDKIQLTDLAVSEFAAVGMYTDSGFSQPVQEILLMAGTPTHVYIRVTAEDDSVKCDYDIAVTRTPRAVEATLTKVAGIGFTPASGSGIGKEDPIRGSVVVPYSKAKIESKDIEVTPSANAKVEMFADPGFTGAAPEIAPIVGTPIHLYMRITTEDNAELYYDVEVTRMAASTDANLFRVAERTLSYSTGTGTSAVDPIQASITVPYSKNQIVRNDIELSDPENAMVSMYANSNFEQEVQSVWLPAGSYSTVYLKIVAEDGATTKYYAVTVRRTSASSNAELLSVADKTIKEGKEKGTASSPKTASITVSSSFNSLSESDLETDSGATARLYKDHKFTNNISSVSLRSGDNTVYIKVTAEDGSTTLHYEIDITRGSSSSSKNTGGGRTQPANVPTSGGGSGSGSDFKDIQNHWAKASIEAMLSRNIFNGVDKKNFAPDVTTTRAMVVTVLSRLDKVYLVGFATPRFNDVPQGLWYSNAVEWAAGQNIVEGVGGGQFNPNGEVTREQISVMLYNYMVYKGYPVPDGSGVGAFGDDAKISPWAKDAVKSMQQAGIIGGKPGNVFDPQGVATRAEVCTILDRFIQKYKS